MPIEMRAPVVGLALALGVASASAQSLPTLRLTPHGAPEKVFDAAADRCAPIDMPDVNPRAFRAADGTVSLFALQFQARALKGPDLEHLKIDCRVALDSAQDADPAKYDGRRYLTATWTPDGKRVAALIHNEYHADHHPGRCTHKTDLACWWNSVLSFRSDDGGESFRPTQPLVVAAAPFRQDVGQGRHRGFFNPSNMVAHGGHVYAFVSTTGWGGQHYGACLMRNADPLNAAGWRAWDGRSFNVQWRDPYTTKTSVETQQPCAPLEPFGFPVGSLVRHRASSTWIAVWEAPRIEGKFATAGFYYATSRDLLSWSAPGLLQATPTMHDPCGANNANRDGALLAYPALLDAKAQGRNFDDVGGETYLFFTIVRLDGCTPGARRTMFRRRIAIAPGR